MKKTKIKSWPKLLISIALCQSAGIIGVIFTDPSSSLWYQALEKPNFMPANWLFGPVWILLYALIGIAIYLIWVSKSKQKNFAMTFFFLHLVLNATWPLVFFGANNINLGFLVITVLWIMILAMLFIFPKINKNAAYLLIPYFLWISFATCLNCAIMQLN